MKVTIFSENVLFLKIDNVIIVWYCSMKQITKQFGGNKMRVNINLECTECGERNYLTNKNKRNNPDRLEVKKYCPRDRKITLHREVKK